MKYRGGKYHLDLTVGQYQLTLNKFDEPELLARTNYLYINNYNRWLVVDYNFYSEKG